MNGQTLTSMEWDNPAEPLKIYGEVVRLAYVPPLHMVLKPICCNMTDDLIVEQVRPIRYTEVRYRLTTFYHHVERRYFWRYVRD